ncbi:MAG TPA: hypothetical protein VJQ79_15270 [Acidimicrobiia bacterium]|nr:hypothetical protein [Acidimicrobiia bacterium]
MRSANELAVGLAFGLFGLALAALTRRWNFDWGLIWGPIALAALSFATPRWPDNLGAFSNLLFAAVAVVAVIAATVSIQRGTGIARTPLPLLISLLGIYATVPDTESILALLGVTVSMAVAWRPFDWARPRWPGAATMSIVICLAVVSGGRGRESSIVGALAAIAVMGLLLCRLWPGSPATPLVMHFLLVGWWSRVAGRADSAGAALLLGLGLTIPVVAVCWVLTRRNPPVKKPAVSP